MKQICYVSGLKRVSGGIESYLSIMKDAAKEKYCFHNVFYTLDSLVEDKTSHPVKISKSEDLFSREAGASFYRKIQNLDKEVGIDALHVHSPNSIPGVLAATYAKKKGIPIIATYHYGKVREDGISDKCAREVLRLADKVICVSKASKTIADLVIGDSMKTDVFYNAIDMDIFYQKEDLSGSLDDNKRFSMIYPAAFCVEKGHLDLVKIMQDLYEQSESKDLSLTLIGRSHPKDHTKHIMKQYISSINQKHGFEGFDLMFNFLDPIPYEAMADVIRNHDVLVFPSHEEGFGLISIEAQACGLPVVGYDVGGISETLQDKITGFLVPFSDTVKFSSYLAKLDEDRSLLKQMSFAAANYVRNEERFHKDTLVKEHLMLYDSLIK